jgi:hypothetical protein
MVLKDTERAATLTCSHPDVTPRQVVQCQIAQGWVAANAFADLSGAGAINQYLQHAISLTELVLKTIRESVALGTVETLTKTGELPSYWEVIEDAAGGLLPGYGTYNAIQDQKATCARQFI